VFVRVNSWGTLVRSAFVARGWLDRDLGSSGDVSDRSHTPYGNLVHPHDPMTLILPFPGLPNAISVLLGGTRLTLTRPPVGVVVTVPLLAIQYVIGSPSLIEFCKTTEVPLLGFPLNVVTVPPSFFAPGTDTMMSQSRPLDPVSVLSGYPSVVLRTFTERHTGLPCESTPLRAPDKVNVAFWGVGACASAGELNAAPLSVIASAARVRGKRCCLENTIWSLLLAYRLQADVALSRPGILEDLLQELIALGDTADCCAHAPAGVSPGTVDALAAVASGTPSSRDATADHDLCEVPRSGAETKRCLSASDPDSRGAGRFRGCTITEQIHCRLVVPAMPEPLESKMRRRPSPR
jgi:hypothetical protein